MTVEELIKELEKYPKTHLVSVEQRDGPPHLLLAVEVGLSGNVVAILIED